MSDAKAVLWYGIYSLSMGGGMLTLYLLLNKYFWIAAYAQGYTTKSVLYTVAGLSWIMVSMFDREMMRGIHSDVVYITDPLDRPETLEGNTYKLRWPLILSSAALIIGGIVVASLGYIVWLRVKKFLKK